MTRLFTTAGIISYSWNRTRFKRGKLEATRRLVQGPVRKMTSTTRVLMTLIANSQCKGGDGGDIDIRVASAVGDFEINVRQTS